MLQTFLLLAVATLTTASAQLSFKRGMLKIGELDFSPSNILSLIIRASHSGWLIGGVLLMILSFLLWLFILSRLQINIAYPITIGLQTVLIAVASWFLFKEYLAFYQILGIAVVILGIFLILKS